MEMFLGLFLELACLKLYLVTNVTGWVQLGKNLSYIFYPRASQNCLLQSILMKLITILSAVDV